MSVQETLLKEIEDSQKWLDIQKEENTYRRELRKGIELINWALEEMKKRDVFICEVY
ncbi:MAG TPA: hypothetical protein VI146_03285 [Nitrososphaeraceae archaeon]